MDGRPSMLGRSSWERWESAMAATSARQALNRHGQKHYQRLSEWPTIAVAGTGRIVAPDKTQEECPVDKWMRMDDFPLPA